jgi:hypothetical protein
MTDPRRWLDPESDARAFEREVLELAKPVRVPAASMDRVWQRVAVLDQATPDAGENGASGGGAATAGSSAGGLAVVKVFVLSALAGLALSGAGYAAFVDDGPSAPVAPVLHPRSSGTVTPVPVVSSQPSTNAEDVQPVPLVPPTTRAPRKATPAPVMSSAPLETAQRLQTALSTGQGAQPTALANQLQEEAALIREGRARLRAGDLGGAFATLEAARTRFPRAVLEEEREALTIELLSQSGRLESARERARAFLVRFPESSLRQRMQELSDSVGGPGRTR